ncbi:MAG: hypothetical protein IPG71_10150 [bacterium]|nr:hypothetical protein [bacterium]
MKILRLLSAMMFVTAAFASTDLLAPNSAPADDRGPVRALDDQCVIDFQEFVYGTHSGSTQHPGGNSQFRLAMFCFTTSNCPELPDTFYTYCTDLNHSAVDHPYCVEIEECVVDDAFPTVTPALAWVITNTTVNDAQSDRIKQLAIWKLSEDRGGGVNNGIPYVHINDGRGYPNVGDAPVFPYVNTVFNTDPLNNDPQTLSCSMPSAFSPALDPTIPQECCELRG